jgi:hypothetical protein
MIYRFFFTFLFLLMLSGLQAQVLELRYQTEAVAENQWETTLSLQALQEDSLIVRAVNFTFLSDSNCAHFLQKTSLLAEAWSATLERSVLRVADSCSYGDRTYNQRLTYGIAEPLGMPGTHSIKVPGSQGKGLPVMRVRYEGSCGQHIYLEDEQENPVNQMGDQNFNPMVYRIKRP